MNIINLLTKDEFKRAKIIEKDEGSVLFNEEEKCDSIGIIDSGEVEISTYLSNGQKVIYNTLRSGEIFGSNLIFSSSPFYKGNVITVSRTRLYLIKKDDLKMLLQNNPQFLECYLKMQSDFTKKLNYRIKLLSMDSARERILFALESEGKRLKIKSITLFAESLHLTREATSRMLSKLGKEGLIEYSNDVIFMK